MKGITKKLEIIPKTMDEQIIKDGLAAVSILNGKEPYYLVGGIATQSYLPTSCRRPTSDIDFSIVRPLNYEQFKLMVNPLIEYLKDHKYSVETKKRSRTYCLDLINSQDETAIIEFARRNNQNFEKNKKKLYRELENSNKKILEERNCTYNVASTEDIAIPKLARIIGSLKRNKKFFRYLSSDLKYLSDEKIKKQLKIIEDFREDAMISPANFELAEELRVLSDIYDIRILSEITGFNENYLMRVEKDWNSLRENPIEKKRLMNILFPCFK